MRYFIAALLMLAGILILLWGDRPLKVKGGKLIKTIDAMNTYGGKLPWLVTLQRVLLKIVLGAAFIFFSLMVYLKKM